MTPKDRDDTLDRLEPAITLVKAALNLIPVGGSIASLLSDYIPSSRQRALEKAVKFFSEKAAEMEGRIKPDTIDKDDFVELFNKFEALAKKTNREEKLRTAANILANALLPAGDPKRSPFDELDHLMHCVDALSSGAITVLGASIQIRPPRHASGGDTPFQFSELRRKLPDVDPHVVLGLATELRSLNLLHMTEGLIGGPDFEGYQLRVTHVGLRFAQRFIEGSM